MGANCSTDPHVGCIYNIGDGQCHHPRKAEGRRLPTYQAGRINCPWGVPRRTADPVDIIRAFVEYEDAKRTKAMHCGPACRYWVYLYYKSEDDFEAVCEYPDRKGMGLPVGQICRVAVPINKEVVDE